MRYKEQSWLPLTAIIQAVITEAVVAIIATAITAIHIIAKREATTTPTHTLTMSNTPTVRCRV